MAAICAVVAIGWLLRIRRIMSREVIDALAQIVYWVATPALIFHTVSTSPFSRSNREAPGCCRYIRVRGGLDFLDSGRDFPNAKS